MTTGAAVIILVILLTDNWTAACLFGSSDGCTFRCHCASEATCNVTNGQCPGKCEAGYPKPMDDVKRYDWRGSACQIGNVAFAKSAEQSGVWNDLVAGNAVDGRLSGGGNDDNANCAHPDAGSGSLAWWRVDLGSIHAIHNVTVFNTKDGGGAQRMTDFEIGVGNATEVTQHALCASHGLPAVAGGGDVTLTCNSPLYGRYVSFRRTGEYEPHLVTICEFVVMGYMQIYAECPHCTGTCDDVLGCRECKPGYSNAPVCDEGCEAGHYGDGCSSACGKCNGSVPCEYADGTCPDGCQQWYAGMKCDLQIEYRKLSAESNPTKTTHIRSRSVDLEWKSEDSLPDRLFSFYGYVVKYGFSESNDRMTSNEVPHQANESPHNISISGLQPGTAYSFQVFIYRKQNGIRNVTEWGANVLTNVVTKTIADTSPMTPVATTTGTTPTSIISPSARTSSSIPSTSKASSSGTSSSTGTHSTSTSTDSKTISTSSQSISGDLVIPPATIGGIAAGASGLLIIVIVAIVLIWKKRRNTEVVGIVESPNPDSISKDHNEDTADNYAAEGPYEKIDDEAIPDGSTCIPVNQLAAYIRDLSSSGDGFEREFEAT